MRSNAPFFLPPSRPGPPPASPRSARPRGSRDRILRTVTTALSSTSHSGWGGAAGSEETGVRREERGWGGKVSGEVGGRGRAAEP